MKKPFLKWTALIALIALIAGAMYCCFVWKKTAPVPADFETKRLEIKARYDAARRAVLNVLQSDLPQTGITMTYGDLLDVEKKFFGEISRWRLDGAVSPEERALIAGEMHAVTYQLALQRQKVRYDELLYDGDTGSGTASYDLHGLQKIYRQFNRRLLLPRKEAMKRRELLRHRLRISCNGKAYETDPGAGEVPFTMYFKYADNEEKEALFVVELVRAWEYKGRKLAIFNIFRDIRGISDGSGNGFAVAELRDDIWQCIHLALADSPAGRNELAADGTLTICLARDETEKVVLHLDGEIFQDKK